MKIEIINIKNYEGDDYIYIGRPSIFGNPYSSKESNLAEHQVDSKKEAIDLYRRYILDDLELLDELINQLRKTGYRKLGCFCKPAGCHGDVLKELIEERTAKSIF